MLIKMSTHKWLREADAKQTLIDELQSSINHHSNAIKRLGEEIIALESSEKACIDVNTKVEGEIALYTDKSTLHAEDILVANCDRLSVAVAILMHRLDDTIGRSNASLTRIQKLQNELIEQNELDVRIEQLRQAHQAQKVFRTSIRDQLKDANSRNRCIKRMEAVISRLEDVIAKEAQTNTGRITVSTMNSPAYELLDKENTHIRMEIARAEYQTELFDQIECEGLGANGLSLHLNRLQDRFKDVQERNALLSRRRDYQSAELYGSHGRVSHKADEVDVNARDLQHQLLNTERAHAEELARLDSKLMETKAAVLHGYSSAAAFMLNESAGLRLY